MGSASFPLSGAASGSATGLTSTPADAGDVLIFQTVDGGEVEIVGGRVTGDSPPATAAYLSLFGGNELDGNIESTDHLQWWGNLIEDDESRHYRSETQHLLRAIPAVSGNLRRVEQAAARDLAWMKADLDAVVTAVASLPALNRLRLDITINIRGLVYQYSFVNLWQAATS